MPCRPGRQTPAVIPAREKASLRDLQRKKEPQMDATVTAKQPQRTREPRMNATMTAKQPQINADERRLKVKTEAVRPSSAFICVHLRLHFLPFFVSL